MSTEANKGEYTDSQLASDVSLERTEAPSRRDVLTLLMGVAGALSVASWPSELRAGEASSHIKRRSKPGANNIIWVGSIGTPEDPKELRTTIGSASKHIAVATGFYREGDGGAVFSSGSTVLTKMIRVSRLSPLDQWEHGFD